MNAKLNHLFLVILVGLSLSCTKEEEETLPENTASIGDFSFVVTEQGDLDISFQDQHLVALHSIEFNFAQPSGWQFIDKTEDTLWVDVLFPEVNFYYLKQQTVDTSARLKFYIDRGGGLVISNERKWEKNYCVSIKHEGDAYYGLTEPLLYDNERSPNLSGKVLDVAVQGYSASYGENYASVYAPMFFSSRGYACYFDTFTEGRFSMGLKGSTRIHHRARNLKMHILPFKDPRKNLQAYYAEIGQPKQVPIWACGPIIWRDQHYHGSKDIMRDAHRFANMQIPLTAMFVDRPYSTGANGWSGMDFNEDFSPAELWLDSLDQVFNTKMMTWVATSTFDSDFPGTLPGAHAYIDLTDSTGTAIYVKKLKKQHEKGVRGHKMDRADERFPYFEDWEEEMDIYKHRNRYPLLYARTTHQVLEERFGKDQFTFARTAYQGCQPYLSAVWGGDVDKSWYGMANNMANALRCSWMGFPIWGTDVGGYAGSAEINDTLYVRWLQWGVFNGLFEIKIDAANHPSFADGPDRAPWNCSPKVQQAFKNACEQRMDWLPYIYSLSNTSAHTGPLMQPMAFAFPRDAGFVSTWDQYMFGPAVLVAPYFSADFKRQVALPSGKWLDLHQTSKRYRGGKTIEVRHDLQNIPLFLKGNSLFLKGNVYNGSRVAYDTAGKDTNYHLEVHAFPGVNGDKALFTYVDPLDKNEHKNILMLTANKDVAFQFPALKCPSRLVCYLEQEPSEVMVNGVEVDYRWDKEGDALYLDMPLNQVSDAEIKW